MPETLGPEAPARRTPFAPASASRPVGGPSASAALWTLALLSVCAAGWIVFAHYPSWELYAPSPMDGELLLHRLGLGRHMPLKSLLPALAQVHHGPLPRELWLPLLRLGAVATVFAAGSLLGSIATATLAAACLILFRQDAFALTYMDLPFTLFVALVAAALLWRARRPSFGRTLAAALAIGASLLYRSVFFALPPLLALAERAALPRGDRRRRQWDVLALCVVPYLFLGPWAALTWKSLGRPSLFEPAEADSNIITGALGYVLTVDGGAAPLAPPDAPRRGAGGVLPWAAGQVVSHPLRYAAAYARRLAFVLSRQPRLYLAAALALLLGRRRRGYGALALLILYYLGVHCFMTVQEDYFFPLAPALWLAAATLLDRFAPPARDRAARRMAGAWAAAALAAALLACCGAETAVVRGAWTGVGRGSGPDPLGRELAARPGDGALLLLRGAGRLASGDLRGAEGDLARAASLLPDWSDPALALAQTRILEGRPDEAACARLGEDPLVRSELAAARALAALRRRRPRQTRSAAYEYLSLCRQGRAQRYDEVDEVRRLASLPECSLRLSQSLSKLHAGEAEDRALSRELGRLDDSAFVRWTARP